MLASMAHHWHSILTAIGLAHCADHSSTLAKAQSAIEWPRPCHSSKTCLKLRT